MIDRFLLDEELDIHSRLSDSASIGFSETKLIVKMYNENDEIQYNTEFSNTFETDGIRFEIPTPQLFAFNSPYGACPSVKAMVRC